MSQKHIDALNACRAACDRAAELCGTLIELWPEPEGEGENVASFPAARKQGGVSWAGRDGRRSHHGAVRGEGACARSVTETGRSVRGGPRRSASIHQFSTRRSERGARYDGGAPAI